MILLFIPLPLSSVFGQAQKIEIDGGDGWGKSISLSNSSMVVGNRSDAVVGINSGSASIYILESELWRLQQKITPLDGDEGDFFGGAVDISGDYIIVGALNDEELGIDAGSAYIFYRVGGTWIQQAKLTASDGGPYATFGESVAIEDDYAIVGSAGANDYDGAAYVFHRTGDTWQEETILTRPGGETGRSVAISGNRVIVGAPHFDGNVHIFRRDGSVWTLEADLPSPNGPMQDYFGFSVGISGNKAIVGAQHDDENGSRSGSAFLYRFDGFSWILLPKFLPVDVDVRHQLGRSVSVSNNLAVVAAAGDNLGLGDQSEFHGSAYVISIGNNDWNVERKLTILDWTEGEYFASNVTIDQELVAVADGGVAYFYKPQGALGWSSPTPVSPPNGSNNEATETVVSWNPLVGSDFYTAEISTNLRFSQILVSETVFAGTTFQFNGLDNSTEYFWRVRGEASGVSSYWSNPFSFETIPSPPNSPGLESPTNLSSAVSRHVSVSWRSVDYADSYQLQVAKGANFQQTIFNQSNILIPNVALPELEPLTTYFWRVRATNFSGTSAWSDIWRFTTVDLLPDVPTLFTPAPGTTTPLLPVLGWDVAARAETYQVQVATSPAFSIFAVDALGVYDHSLVPPRLESGRVYFWRVRAFNSGGTTAWSDVWNFTAVNQAPIVLTSNPPVELVIGQADFSADLSVVFSDPDGDPLSFVASTTNKDIATVSVSNSSLTIHAVSKGDATITVSAYDGHGGETETTFEVSVPTGVGLETVSEVQPRTFALYQNYPNPLNPATTITFAIPTPSHVTLTVYDIMGRAVDVLVDGTVSVGVHSVKFQAFDLPSGVYLYRLNTLEGTFARSMAVLK